MFLYIFFFGGEDPKHLNYLLIGIFLPSIWSNNNNNSQVVRSNFVGLEGPFVDPTFWYRQAIYFDLQDATLDLLTPALYTHEEYGWALKVPAMGMVGMEANKGRFCLPSRERWWLLENKLRVFDRRYISLFMVVFLSILRLQVVFRGCDMNDVFFFQG